MGKTKTEAQLKKEAKERLKEAEERGFKNKVKFISTSGMSKGFVRGKIVFKWVYPHNYELGKKDPEYLEDATQNGDIVSESGIGCIYDAKTDTWAEIINN